MGLMLESCSERLCAPGGPHHGSPDKHPRLRLKTIHDAGELKIPFTTGLLVGIGETRRERWDSLLAIASLHEEFGPHPRDHHPELRSQRWNANERCSSAKDG